MIKDAAVEDLETIVFIYNAAIPRRLATADTEPVSVASRQKWFRQHIPGKHPLWVIQQAQRIAGWLSFSPFYGRPAYAATAELSVYVAPDMQRQGLARQLLEQAIARAPGLGLETPSASSSPTTSPACSSSSASGSGAGGTSRGWPGWTPSNEMSRSSADGLLDGCAGGGRHSAPGGRR